MAGKQASAHKRTPGRKAATKPEPIWLDTKIEPSQERARDTFETILETTGLLLGEVGFERLSTNMICQRAGMTPPALYRYFPNKYAILKELGRRLMEEQDHAAFDWIDAGGLETESVEDTIASNLRLQTQINEITRRFPGGVWILRVLRVVPVLREVRVESRDLVAQRVFDAMRSRFPGVSDDQLLAATRLTTELMYAATEMVIEEPELDDQITHELCRMIAYYYAGLRLASNATAH